MKIALISDIYSPTEAETCTGRDIASHVLILAEGLARIGHKVLIGAPEPSLAKPVVEGRLVKCSGKHTENWAGIQLSKAGEKQLEEKLNAFQPDLLHIHTLSATGSFVVQYATERHIPVLLTVHTLEDLEKSGHLFSPMALWQEHLRIQTAQHLLSESRNIAVLSEAMAQSLYQDGIRIIGQRFPVAIDTEAFYPGASESFQRRTLADSLTLNGKTVVLCGGCDDDSIYPFLEEWGRAFSDSDPFRLLLLNSEAQTGELYSLIHSLRLSERVSLAGTLSREELAACYELSCCYVSCSHSEILHLSAAEAAACGTPLLIRAGSGTASLVENKHNGFIWSSESELFGFIRKFARVTGPGRDALVKMVSGTMRTLTPQNQARAAESLYLSLLP